MTNCPVCEEQARILHRDIYDDRYGCPGSFIVYRCEDCGHSFSSGVSEALAAEQLYTRYYPRATLDPAAFKPKSFPGGFSSWLNGDASAACWWVPEAVKILDIGCGYCETVAYHQSRGCEVAGVEVDENVRTIADKFQFDVQIGSFEPANFAPESFDYVTLQQVIEHVDNPLETLQGVTKILRPGGYAVLTTPNAKGWGARIFGKKWINWHLPYHQHFLSPSALDRMSRAVGLEVESVRTVTSSEWLKYQWIHLLSFPKIGEPSAFWSPHGHRSLLLRAGQRLTEVLHLLRVNHLLTRIFDAMNLGDNLLIILKKP